MLLIKRSDLFQMLLIFLRFDNFFLVEKKFAVEENERNKVFEMKSARENNSKCFRTSVGVENIKLLQMLQMLPFFWKKVKLLLICCTTG